MNTLAKLIAAAAALIASFALAWIAQYGVTVNHGLVEVSLGGGYRGTGTIQIEHHSEIGGFEIRHEP
jgi:hypothetical protein